MNQNMMERQKKKQLELNKIFAPLHANYSELCQSFSCSYFRIFYD